MSDSVETERRCRGCVHFHNDPAYLEKAMPGWSSLGSAWGSTRAEDGICTLRELYLSASQGCERFEGRRAAALSR